MEGTPQEINREGLKRVKSVLVVSVLVLQENLSQTCSKTAGKIKILNLTSSAFVSFKELKSNIFGHMRNVICNFVATIMFCYKKVVGRLKICIHFGGFHL